MKWISYDVNYISWFHKTWKNEKENQEPGEYDIIILSTNSPYNQRLGSVKIKQDLPCKDSPFDMFPQFHNPFI